VTQTSKTETATCRVATPSPTDVLLDAAEAVVLQAGVNGLTLDKVAAKAGVSKGGLMHHFPSKNALVEAMLARIVTSWRQCLADTFSENPTGPGHAARSLASLCMADLAEGEDDPWDERLHRMSMVILAALVHDPRHIEPVRQVYRELFDKLERDGLAPGNAELVMAAIDGVWLWRIFALDRPTPERRAALGAAIHRAARELNRHVMTSAPAPARTNSTPMQKDHP
jgi:AcrR family transcriptional regulator